MLLLGGHQAVVVAAHLATFARTVNLLLMMLIVAVARLGPSSVW